MGSVDGRCGWEVDPLRTHASPRSLGSRVHLCHQLILAHLHLPLPLLKRLVLCMEGRSEYLVQRREE